jgi:NADH-quinone oxidoreductase subunit J
MVVLGTVLVYTLWKTSWEVNTAAPEGAGIPGLGKALLTTYVLPFEVVSVLLLSALVGAITIARKETK